MQRSTRLLGLLSLALPLGLFAQNNPPPAGSNAPRTTTTTYDNTASGNTETANMRRDRLRDSWGTFVGPQQGDFEFTFGGGGSANRDINSSFGGIDSSFGLYLSDSLLVSVRQSIDYSNPNNAPSGWGGATRVALDKHLLTRERLRPFVGINAGFLYGKGINDTFTAGLETGLKYYIQPRAFTFALVEYAWTFDSASDARDNFDQGGFRWTLGVGLNF